jgi:hypothetical protein
MPKWYERLLGQLGLHRSVQPDPESVQDPVATNGSALTLSTEQIGTMVRSVLATREDEIGCDECFEQLDAFVEMKLAGKSAADALPLVQDHLNRCGNCREEFEALLQALEAAN